MKLPRIRRREARFHSGWRVGGESSRRKTVWTPLRDLEAGARLSARDREDDL